MCACAKRIPITGKSVDKFDAKCEIKLETVTKFRINVCGRVLYLQQWRISNRQIRGGTFELSEGKFNNGSRVSRLLGYLLVRGMNL